MRRLAVFVRVIGVSIAFFVVSFAVGCFYMAFADSICSSFVQRAVRHVSMRRFVSSSVWRTRGFRKHVAHIGSVEHEKCHDGQMIRWRALTRARQKPWSRCSGSNGYFDCRASSKTKIWGACAGRLLRQPCKSAQGSRSYRGLPG